MPVPFTVRWGIVSTGAIATRFAQDLLVDPGTRGADDVVHKIAAVGSRAVPSAQAFIDKLKAGTGACAWGVASGHLDGARAYGSYDELFADPGVDAVYIGTPHTFHHANARAALLAGKHVLCEKPFTLDMDELDDLIRIAKDRGLFLMEAVWTRFHPIAYALQDLLKSGRLGRVHRMTADFSMNFEPDCERKPTPYTLLTPAHPDSSRMIDPELCGGSLLDQGPYPSLWAMLVMHHHPDNTDRAPKVVSSYQSIYARSGVDAASHWIVRWDGLGTAACTTDMTTTGLNDASVVVSCEEADVPDTLTIVPHASFEPGSIKVREVQHLPVHAGHGMHYEADEVARCLRDGKKESARVPLDESRITQGFLDSVRKAGDSVLKSRPTVGK